ncbi:MAG: O-antigen ligase family protein [Promethearchaeia archaeon]
MNNSAKILPLKLTNKLLSLIATIIFLPGLLYVRFVGGTWLATNHHYPSYVQSLIILMIIVIVWLMCKWLFSNKVYLTGAELYLIPFLITIGISTAFSENFSLSVEKLIGVGAYIFLAFIFIDIRARENIWKGFIDAILMVNGIVALFGLYFIFYWLGVYQISVSEILLKPVYVLKVMPRMPNIAHLHTTISAGYFLMVFPLFVFRYKKTDNVIIKIVIVLVSVISLLIFFLTKSRSGMIGLFVSLVAATYIYKDELLGFITKNALRKHTFVISCFLIFLGILGFVFVSRGFSFFEKSMLCRYQAWLTALKIVKNNPIFGAGLETFGENFLKFRNPEYCSAILHVAHNDLLHFSSQFGLAGLITFGIFMNEYHNLIVDEKNNERLFYKLGLISISGFLGMGVMSTMLYSPNIVLLLIFFMVGIIPIEKIKLAKKRKTVLIILSGIASIFMIIGIWDVWKLQPYYLARNAVNARNWNSAETHLREAIKRDQNFIYYHHALAFVVGQKACENKEYVREAISHYSSPLEYYNGWALEHFNVASLWAELNEYQMAAEEMEKATKYDPKNAQYYCKLGEYYFWLDNQTYSIDNYATCLALRPAWIDSPYWQKDDYRKQILTPAIDKAEEKIKKAEESDMLLQLGKLYYYSNRFEESRFTLNEYLGEHPKSSDALYIKSLLMKDLGNDQLAMNIVDSVVEYNPRQYRGWELKGELMLKGGALKEGEKSLNISHHLGGSPRTYWMLGELFRAKDNMDLELAVYEKLVNKTEKPSYNSHWIASRWHMEIGDTLCSSIIRTYDDFYDPINIVGNNIESKSCVRAACYYSKLLENYPGDQEIHAKFMQLECLEDFDGNECDKESFVE